MGIRLPELAGKHKEPSQPARHPGPGSPMDSGRARERAGAPSVPRQRATGASAPSTPQFQPLPPFCCQHGLSTRPVPLEPSSESLDSPRNADSHSKPRHQGGRGHMSCGGSCQGSTEAAVGRRLSLNVHGARKVAGESCCLGRSAQGQEGSPGPGRRRLWQGWQDGRSGCRGLPLVTPLSDAVPRPRGTGATAAAVRLGPGPPQRHLVEQDPCGVGGSGPQACRPRRGDSPRMRAGADGGAPARRWGERALAQTAHGAGGRALGG